MSLVTVLVLVVHLPLTAGGTPSGREPAAAQVAYDQRIDPQKLPRPVHEMVDAILVAVHSGQIEDLKTALEWNEMQPALAPDKVEDPIEFLKSASDDKQGREILAVLGDLLAVGPARLKLGRDLENNEVYVWPYLAELDIDALKPSEMVDLYRLVPAAVIAQMRNAKKWTSYRIVIGADGTWHSFMKHN